MGIFSRKKKKAEQKEGGEENGEKSSINEEEVAARVGGVEKEEEEHGGLEVQADQKEAGPASLSPPALSHGRDAYNGEEELAHSLQAEESSAGTVWHDLQLWLEQSNSHMGASPPPQLAADLETAKRLLSLHRTVVVQERKLRREREEIFEECGGMLEALKLIHDLGEERRWEGKLLAGVKDIMDGKRGF
eukprot:CAMPEP_0113892170 /NCGR_PEP_ID=MMETSP0780_2-20120614/15245_1 /TAXON_ID=652834 /ORGANISM="Palpitomonas bilix" /LENGTH=189 /DNA_ID=CAMNT_0000882033 /DNA_START=99 /DNA_END=669 /DNA_ORIENTATION=+ /assembly_acc=CAM_ASM_000599